MSKKPGSAGRVRVRSNVVYDENAWHLVPGDALYASRPEKLKAPNRPTWLQRAEHLYYVPCSVCRRPSYQTSLTGCAECLNGPSSDEIRAAKAAHERALEAVALIRAESEGSE